MSKTPITDRWKREWAGESQYIDPIVEDAVEVMTYLETRTNDQECECSAFADAQKSCTDSEGYGALIRAWDGSWQTGCELPPMVFCPWCGLKLSSQNASLSHGDGSATPTPEKS